VGLRGQRKLVFAEGLMQGKVSFQRLGRNLLGGIAGRVLRRFQLVLLALRGFSLGGRVVHLAPVNFSIISPQCDERHFLKSGWMVLD
jgi:hypothetical protein